MLKVVFQFYVLEIKNSKLGWRLQASFQIHLHKKHREVLEKIRMALGGVGEVYDSDSKGCVFVQVQIESIIFVMF
jgi:hypothetical protein